MHNIMALWIRGCLINVRIQSIAGSHVTGLPCSSSSSTLPLLFSPFPCHLPSLSFPLLILLFISPSLCPKVTTKGTYSVGQYVLPPMTEIMYVGLKTGSLTADWITPSISDLFYFSLISWFFFHIKCIIFGGHFQSFTLHKVSFFLTCIIKEVSTITDKLYPETAALWVV